MAYRRHGNKLKHIVKKPKKMAFLKEKDKLKPDFGYWVSLSRQFRQRAMAAGYQATMAQAAALRVLHGG